MSSHTNNKIYNEEILSKTITYLRFPLIVLVVLLHTIIIDQNCFGKIVIPHGKYPIFDISLHILQRNIGDIAVPLFFFISGFLFFYNIESFDINKYENKLKKRVKTLLIPYMIWNSLFILFILSCHYIYPSIVKSFNDYFTNLTFISFLQSYWSIDGGPFLAPMWFVRDLMVLAFLSPIIYILIKKTGYYIVIITFLIFIFGFDFGVPGIEGRIWFPYMFGAYFSILRLNFINTLNNYNSIIYSCFILSIIIDTWLFSIGKSSTIINHLSLILGLLAIPLICAYFLNKGTIHENPFLAKASFFVFGFHMFIINIPNKLLPLLIPINTFSAIFLQILIPLIVCILCLIIYSFLDRFFPKLSNFLVGGR